MSAQHTPGPWKAHKRSVKSKNFGVYDSGGYLLAALEVHQLAKPERVESRKQDAILMAMAPEVRDAFARLLELCDGKRANGTPEFHNAVAIGRALLARKPQTTGGWA